MNKRLSLHLRADRPLSSHGERDFTYAKLGYVELKTMVMHGIELTEERLDYFKSTYRMSRENTQSKYNKLVNISYGKREPK